MYLGLAHLYFNHILPTAQILAQDYRYRRSRVANPLRVNEIFFKKKNANPNTDSGGVVPAPAYGLTKHFQKIYMSSKEQCLFPNALIHVKLHHIDLVLNKFYVTGVSHLYSTSIPTNPGKILF